MVFEKKTLTYKGKPVFEKIGSPRFKRSPKSYEENEACFMFVEHGEFNVRTQDSFLTLDKKHGLLSKCFNYFFEQDKAQYDNTDYVQVIGVLFYPDIIIDLFDFKSLRSSKQKKHNVEKVRITPLLILFKNSIDYLLDNPSLATEDLIELKLKEFLHIIIQATDQFDNILSLFSNLFDPIKYDFKLTIKNNLYSNLTIHELATLCNMSLSNFKRKFKDIYNDTPKEYLLKAKIEKVCNLLTSKNYSIEYIADECGFDYTSTLNRNFKKLMGCTPIQYRNFNH